MNCDKAVFAFGIGEFRGRAVGRGNLDSVAEVVEEREFENGVVDSFGGEGEIRAFTGEVGNGGLAGEDFSIVVAGSEVANVIGESYGVVVTVDFSALAKG